MAAEKAFQLFSWEPVRVTATVALPVHSSTARHFTDFQWEGESRKRTTCCIFETRGVGGAGGVGGGQNEMNNLVADVDGQYVLHLRTQKSYAEWSVE